MCKCYSTSYAYISLLLRFERSKQYKKVTYGYVTSPLFYNTRISTMQGHQEKRGTQNKSETCNIFEWNNVPISNIPHIYNTINKINLNYVCNLNLLQKKCNHINSVYVGFKFPSYFKLNYLLYSGSKRTISFQSPKNSIMKDENSSHL
jgi:hypothetical protein